MVLQFRLLLFRNPCAGHHPRLGSDRAHSTHRSGRCNDVGPTRRTDRKPFVYFFTTSAESLSWLIRQVVVPTTSLLPSTAPLVIPTTTPVVTPSSTFLISTRPVATPTSAATLANASASASSTSEDWHLNVPAILIPTLLALAALGALTWYILHARRKTQQRRTIAQRHISWSDVTGRRKAGEPALNDGKENEKVMGSEMSFIAPPSTVGVEPSSVSIAPTEAIEQWRERERQLDSANAHDGAPYGFYTPGHSPAPAYATYPADATQYPGYHPTQSEQETSEENVPRAPHTSVYLAPRPTSSFSASLPPLPPTTSTDQRISFAPPPPLPPKESSLSAPVADASNPWSRHPSRFSAYSSIAPSVRSAYDGLSPTSPGFQHTAGQDVPAVPALPAGIVSGGEEWRYSFLDRFINEEQEQDAKSVQGGPPSTT